MSGVRTSCRLFLVGSAQSRLVGLAIVIRCSVVRLDSYRRYCACLQRVSRARTRKLLTWSEDRRRRKWAFDDRKSDTLTDVTGLAIMSCTLKVSATVWASVGGIVVCWPLQASVLCPLSLPIVGPACQVPIVVIGGYLLLSKLS